MSLGQDFNDIKGGLHPLAEFRNAAQESAATIAFRQQAIEMGMKGDDIVAGVIKTAAAAAKEVQGSIAERAEKQAKERFDDAMFLALLDSIDAQIAENERIMSVLEETMTQLSSGEIDVHQAMSRPEVLDAIRDWEKRTGRAYDPNNDNAAEELMVIMQEKHDLVAADTILRKNEFNTIAEQVPGFDKRFDVEPTEVRIEVQSVVDKGASQSTAVMLNTEKNEITSMAQESRDEHRELQFSSITTIDNSAAEIDDLFGGDKVAELAGFAVEEFDSVRTVDTNDIEPSLSSSPKISVDPS